MLAISLSIVIVAMWMFVGLGLFSATKFVSSFHFRLLLSPALGLAASVIALFTLSRIGLPVKMFAVPLACFLAAFFAYVVLFRRRVLTRTAFWVTLFLCLFVVVQFWTPLLRYGFEWLAFVNGDMSYYSLSSTRFLNYGFSELPASGNIFDIKDHSLFYWYFPNVLGGRTGADLLLAFVVGVTGLTAHQAYMPLMIACHVCVATSAGALALSSARKWESALWTIALLALSPMLTLEVSLQQLAQAMGLAFLVSVCFSYAKATSGGRTRAWSGLAILAFSCLTVTYLEVIPFFGLFVLLFEFTRRSSWRDATLRKALLWKLFGLSAGVAVVLNGYLIDAMRFLLWIVNFSFKSGAMTMQRDGLSLFPHFFLPGNGATLFGWMPVGGGASSLLLFVGLVAAAVFFVLAGRLAVSGTLSALMSVSMLCAACVMYIGGNGYGLFKIAMYIQPFFLSTCVIVAFGYITRKFIQRILLTGLSCSFLPVQQQNIAMVSGELGAAPVAYASSARLGEQLREIGKLANSMPDSRVFSDSPIIELYALQSYYFRGISFESASLETILRRNTYIQPEFTESAKSAESSAEEFEFFGTSGSDKMVFFPTTSIKKTDLVLTTSCEFSVINRSTSASGKKLLLLHPDELVNHLIFKQTSLSTSGFSSGKKLNVLSQLEADPFFVGGTMSSVGRYHLYEVAGAASNSKFRLSLSASMNRASDFVLPPSAVAGAGDSLPLQVVGRGSARLLSSSINPRKIRDSQYVGIDFGRDGEYLGRDRAGVAGMFGKNIKTDSRAVVAFARDISLLAPDAWASLKRPQSIESFPVGLKDEALEYSGIFEDGWISDAAYVILSPVLNDTGTETKVLHLSGVIPDIAGAPFSTTLSIKIDGRTIYRQLHGKGEFNISVPVSVGANAADYASGVKIEIESSALQRLPNGDDRPVSLRLSRIGF